MADLVFGNVKHPAFVDRYIPDADTDAWNDLGQRKPVGTCRHSMWGNLISTDRWFRDSATHKASGLTDYGVGNGDVDGTDLDGVIYRWNDPLGRRAGWASGGSDGLEGDGVAFVRNLGVSAINRDLVSIERSDGGRPDTRMTTAQFNSICQLGAFWFDYAEVPFSSFPLNPKVGVRTDMEHFEFATKACPFTYMRAHTADIQAEIKKLLEAGQTAGAVVTPPVVEPAPEWPNGWTFAELKAHFGKLLEVRMNPKTNEVAETAMRGFSKDGIISNMWLQRAVAEGITDVKRIPKPSQVTITRAKDGTGSSTLLVPRSGYKDWIGFRGDGNSSWIWLQ